MYAWILRSFKSLSKEESDERFDDSDENEDGFVSWKEYAAEEFDLDELEKDTSDPMYEEESMFGVRLLYEEGIFKVSFFSKLLSSHFIICKFQKKGDSPQVITNTMSKSASSYNCLALYLLFSNFVDNFKILL